MSPNALAAAIDALFGDPNVGRDAMYVPQGDATKPVRVIARRPDAISDFGDARLWSETQVFDLRVSEIAEPWPGDLIELGDEVFAVQGGAGARSRAADLDSERWAVVTLRFAIERNLMPSSPTYRKRFMALWNDSAMLFQAAS